MNWKLWLIITEVLFALCGVSHGQERMPVNRQVEVLKPQGETKSGFDFGWYKLAAEREVNDQRLGKTLSDIESRMPAGHVYRDNDVVTWAHETTHGINSRVRCEVGGMVNAFYCLNGWVGVYREPNFRKSQVCQFVPANLRGLGWETYMAGASSWDDRPLYILDEWVAYINGAIVGRELQAAGVMTDRVMRYDVLKCVEFSGYASALMQAIEQLDPSYPDKAKLEEFIAYNIKRSMKLTDQAEFSEPVRAFEVSYAPAGNCQSGNCGVMQWQQNVWVQPRPVLGGTKTIVTKPKAVITTPAQPPLVPVKPTVPATGIAGPPGPAGKDGRDGADGKDAAGIDDSTARELQLADQKNSAAIEAVKRQAEIDRKAIDDAAAKVKANTLAQQGQAIMIQRLDSRVASVEKRMSGQLTFRLLYDPKTGKLSPVK